MISLGGMSNIKKKKLDFYLGGVQVETIYLGRNSCKAGQ